MKPSFVLIASIVIEIILSSTGIAAPNNEGFFIGVGFTPKYINGNSHIRGGRSRFEIKAPPFSHTVVNDNGQIITTRPYVWGLNLSSKWLQGIFVDAGYQFSQRLGIIGSFGYFDKRTGFQMMNWAADPLSHYRGRHGIFECATGYREVDGQLILRYSLASTHWSLLGAVEVFHVSISEDVMWRWTDDNVNYREYSSRCYYWAATRAAPAVGVEYARQLNKSLKLYGNMVYSFIEVAGGFRIKLGVATKVHL